MSHEGGWAILPMCESCDEYTPAEYVLPQLGGTMVIVCSGHAQGWLDADSAHLLPAAMSLRSLNAADRQHVLGEIPDPMKGQP